jgi:hypothetical protein
MQINHILNQLLTNKIYGAENFKGTKFQQFSDVLAGILLYIAAEDLENKSELNFFIKL